MTQSRRRVLMAGGALGVLAAGLAGCDPTTVVDNATGANTTTTAPTGAPPPAGTGDGNQTGVASGNTTGSAGDPTGTTPGGSGGGGTLPPGPPVRYDVASAQGQAMLAIYAKAVGLMMALPATDPRSWTFQWYSHWVKGAQDSSGKSSQLTAVFGSSSSPARSLAQVMWDGCQAHGENQDESFFLPWHRLYVMAFEGVIRGITGEPNFTLPYWNYVGGAEAAIPPQFRQPNDPVWGPLFNPNRNAAVNGGGAIASAAALSADVLAETSYSPLGADQGFCANLDLGLHGTVHVGVGNSTDGMGVIPWAADDPIFWLHHCNIDRMWASWNALGNANPSDAAFMSKPFPFAGPNGAQVVYTVAQALSLQQAGYGYDALVGESGQSIPQTARQSVQPPAPFRLPQFDTANAATTQPPPPPEPPRRPIPVLRTLPSITHVSEGVRLGGGGALRIRLVSTQGAPELAARTLAPLIAPAVRMQRRSPPPPPSAAARVLGFLNLKAARPPAPVASAAPPAPAPPPPQHPRAEAGPEGVHGAEQSDHRHPAGRALRDLPRRARPQRRDTGVPDRDDELLLGHARHERDGEHGRHGVALAQFRHHRFGEHPRRPGPARGVAGHPLRTRRQALKSGSTFDRQCILGDPVVF